MKKVTRYAGFDVHADTIAVAVAEGGRDGEVRQLGIIPNRPQAVWKLIQKLGPKGLQVCYEAGPTAYALCFTGSWSNSASRARWWHRRWCR
jgi:hypothetical protein